MRRRVHKFNAKRSQGLAPRPSTDLLWYASKAEADYAGELRLRQMAPSECAAAVFWWSPQPKLPLPREAGMLREPSYIGDFLVVSAAAPAGLLNCHVPVKMRQHELSRISKACEALRIGFTMQQLNKQDLARTLSPWTWNRGGGPAWLFFRDVRVWWQEVEEDDAICQTVLPFVTAPLSPGLISVVDVKGFRTRDYLRKRRAVKEVYGLEIEEAPVRAARAADRRGKRGG